MLKKIIMILTFFVTLSFANSSNEKHEEVIYQSIEINQYYKLIEDEVKNNKYDFQSPHSVPCKNVNIFIHTNLYIKKLNTSEIIQKG